MKVEIWSDFACPFCYIGKRRFEKGLSQFAHKDQVEVIFRSFQLQPDAKKNTDKNIYAHLAEQKGITYVQAKQMHDNLTEQAAELGLDYQFDTMIPTNTFDAHRLSHFAQEHGKMKEMIERILMAYFTESLHIGDCETLAKLAADVGLNQVEVVAMLADDQYAEEVHTDQAIAAQIGATGVPFFVFCNKYAVSGAQPAELFLEVLEKVWSEESESN